MTPHRIDQLVVVAALAASRLLYAIGGVRFDDSSLVYSSQLLDQTWLQDRTFESIVHLHSQPPLFNLGVGLVLRWSPLSPQVSFALVYLALGVVLALASLDLLRRLGLGRWSAVAVAVVVCCGPPVVLYENWLSYEYPVAVALVVLVDLAARYGADGRRRWLVAATTVASLVVLTRSMFHPAWLVAVALALVAYRRPSWRSLAWAAVPLLVVVAVMGKNVALFGSPQLSSWLGYNLDKIVQSPLTADQRAQLADEGLEPTDPGPCDREHPDVPALAEETKPTPAPGEPEPIRNFNDECLIDEYRALQDDALEVAGDHPDWIARNVGGAAEIWATPSSLTPFVFDNRNQVGAADDLYRRIVLLDVGWTPPIAIPTAWPVAASAPDGRFHLSLTVAVTTLAVTVAGVIDVLRWRRRDARTLAMVVGAGTVLYATAAAVLLEYGENNRIRFVVEPLTLLLAAVVVARVLRWAVARRAARRQEGPDPAPSARSASSSAAMRSRVRRVDRSSASSPMASSRESAGVPGGSMAMDRRSRSRSWESPGATAAP